MLSELLAEEVKHRLGGDGLVIHSGPFSFRLISTIESVADGLRLLYADTTLAQPDEFADFTVVLKPSGGIRRWWRPQVEFIYDGARPFVPLPLDHAFPLLEWAMNWCISTHAHHFLMLHAAVLERHGHAVIMPAPPGSGKSTLSAGLASCGWRLLSDELTLIGLADGLIVPLGRPVSLKNQSLAVIRQFAPGAVLNRVTLDTAKGSVAHMKAPGNQEHAGCTALPTWVVFPKYVHESEAELTDRSKAGSLLELGRNSFNYTLLGLTGFELLAAIVSRSDCYDFRYSRLEDAVAVFEGLARKEGK
jgi:HprK-related kinase A